MLTWVSNIPEAMEKTVQRHFLSWNKPLIEAATELLTLQWEGRDNLELSKFLVVVPTQQSGRRLREHLAWYVGEKCGKGVFPPTVVTPQFLLSLRGEDINLPEVATAAQATLAWIEVLSLAGLLDYPHLFPLHPPDRTFQWTLTVADEFAGLRRSLGESGLSCAEVARQRKGCEEGERWKDLARLETEYLACLKSRDLQDGEAAKRACADFPRLPDSFERILVIGVSDPVPLVVRALEKLAKTVPVEVAIYADETERDQFDTWGRPVTESWVERKIELPHFEDRVRLLRDPTAQAGEIVSYLEREPQATESLAIGALDREVVPILQRQKATHPSLPDFYDPEGDSIRGQGPANLLSCLSSLVSNRDFAAFEELLRCADFLRYLESEGDGIDGRALLKDCDDLRSKHLPSTLDDALSFARGGLKFSLYQASFILKDLDGIKFVESLPKLLVKIYGQREFDPDQPGDRAFLSVASAVNEILAQLARFEAGQKNGQLDAERGLRLMAELLGKEPIYPEEKAPGSVELTGWLELLWEDAPHLILAGLNDGIAPQSVTADPWLPDGLRHDLGLQTNADRFARDAYLLNALAGSRRDSGRIDALFGKFSLAGDPLKPSRLLFRCPDEELPQRALYLFREIGETGNLPEWQTPWRLQPPPPTLFEKISVTAFRAYLECPFRFYLNYGLGMRSVDPDKSEIDALDFGNLCHDMLEAMAGDETIKNSTDPAEIEHFLLAQCDELTANRYGAMPPIGLTFQFDSLKERLRRLAWVQAQERRDGWEIERAEFKIHQDAEWILGGLPVHGKIDRIDRRGEEIRVLDYKTSDTAVAAERAHWVSVRGNVEGVPEFALFDDAGTAKRWKDLQLPLYCLALEQVYGEGRVTHCGYFNIPKALDQVGIQSWELTPGLLDAARTCAEGVIASIQAGVFWPPKPKVAYENFQSLLFGRPDLTVDPAVFETSISDFPDAHV